jgi:hypothetical protein
MTHYTVTARLWLKLNADSEEEARQRSKILIDNALYDYVAVQNHADAQGVGISKAQVRVHISNKKEK